jgi:hypothetical protein
MRNTHWVRSARAEENRRARERVANGGDAGIVAHIILRKFIAMQVRVVGCGGVWWGGVGCGGVWYGVVWCCTVWYGGVCVHTSVLFKGGHCSRLQQQRSQFGGSGGVWWVWWGVVGCGGAGWGVVFFVVVWPKLSLYDVVLGGGCSRKGRCPRGGMVCCGVVWCD